MIDSTFDPTYELWERRDKRFFVLGTDREFILVTWRGAKDEDVDGIIERHNQALIEERIWQRNSQQTTK